MRPFKNKKNLLILLIVFFAFLGFLDATYLTILHYQNIIPPCSLTSGCERVLTSPYSQIGIVPVSLLGSIFFLTIIVLSIIILQSKKSHFSLQKALLGSALIGFLVSLGFFLIQLLILRAFCPYCLTSETISLLILTLSIALIRLNKN